ncbi:unnamed protein product [Haemonchus placei]|uniref:Uncharacterized protein n=1 Tax=Haemonchus placei TaxID=6290 RepID=A0A0N4WL29_HAEPC|nr:unnamed protein product [Haemonchus placei]
MNLPMRSSIHSLSSREMSKIFKGNSPSCGWEGINSRTKLHRAS